jgi:chromatin structure-remodeling complex protein RSC7
MRSRFNSQLAASRRENTDGVYDIHTNVMQFPANMQPTHARWELVVDHESTIEPEQKDGLPHLDPVYGRNFRIHDLCVESAPESWFAPAGVDGADGGLSSIPPAIIEELPADCLLAFREARMREEDWRSKWHTEGRDGLRARLLPSFEWFPK